MHPRGRSAGSLARRMLRHGVGPSRRQSSSSFQVVCLIMLTGRELTAFPIEHLMHAFDAVAGRVLRAPART